MALKHLDVCTHIVNQEDRDILTRPLFDVNMRLYQTSPTYRAIVQDCANYILSLARTEREGYKKPHGFSGANAGIPFNIIADTERAYLNPVVREASGKRFSTSNCGSLTLDKPLDIWRYAMVTINYFNLQAEACEVKGYLPTLQHEIDHNLGVLITHRRL